VIQGLGVDLVEVARIRRAIQRRGDRFLERVFRPAERAYCDARPHRFEHYAVRFAAKEAVLKVLRTGWSSGLGFKDVEVRRDPDGAPSAILSEAALSFARKRGIARVVLSLSHSDHWAIAQAIGVGV
jgi:holo-[acyl-carrier protein] synthase